MNNDQSLMLAWGTLKERLKQKYSQLSDNDLAYVKGGEDETLRLIAGKTGATREELDEQVRQAIAAVPADPIVQAA
jgi:hypothetical protein